MDLGVLKGAEIFEGVMIEIYDRAVKNERESEKQGKPIFDQAEFIRKKVPNARDVYFQPVKSTDRERYASLFEKIERGENVRLEGTPVEAWPALDVTQVATLKAANIYTVQQLAELPETGLHRLPSGYRQLINTAKKFVSHGVELETLQSELKARDDLIAKQSSQIESLAERVKALETKPRRGRPPNKKE